MKREFRLVEFCKNPYDTIFSVHPVFTELFNVKSPQSNVILGKNIILDGHHTLYKFCEDSSYGEKISIHTTNFVCMDICDLYNEIVVDDDYYFYSYKFADKSQIFYLQECETDLIYQVVFPVIRNKNGYEKFLQQAQDNKILKNCIQKNFRIYTEKASDLAYPGDTLSECTITIITGKITNRTASIKYEEYIDNYGNLTLEDQFEETSPLNEVSYSDIINIYIKDLAE